MFDMMLWYLAAGYRHLQWQTIQLRLPILLENKNLVART
jgi:hypothetical protein